MLFFCLLCKRRGERTNTLKKNPMPKQQIAVLFIVAALLAVAVCAQNEGGDKKEQRNIARAPRSIIQACRETIKAECSSAKERRNVFACLESKTKEELGTECSNWVEARKSCSSAVKDKCDEKKTSLRACLRKAEKDSLPSTCKDSDYFKALTSARGGKRFASGIVI